MLYRLRCFNLSYIIIICQLSFSLLGYKVRSPSQLKLNLDFRYTFRSSLLVFIVYFIVQHVGLGIEYNQINLHSSNGSTTIPNIRSSQDQVCLVMYHYQLFRNMYRVQYLNLIRPEFGRHCYFHNQVSLSLVGTGKHGKVSRYRSYALLLVTPKVRGLKRKGEVP